MSEIIYFPEDQTIRAEKIRHFSEKKDSSRKKSAQNRTEAPVKRPLPKNAIVHLAGLADLAVCVKDLNCTCKYVNDAIYKTTMAINRLTIAIAAFIISAVFLILFFR